MAEVYKGDLVAVESTALESITRGEVDTQVSTAHRYPRDAERGIEKAKAMALKDPDTAGSMFYSMPREDKMIQGPSVRLAEILAVTWGNLRVQARLVEEGEKHIVAQGVAHDLESNFAVSYDVRRSIWGKRGRYSENMIQVTANAACSIAFREAVFHAIPRLYVNQIYEDARRLAVGNQRTLGERATKMLQHFAQIGVQESRVLSFLGRQSTQEITLADVEKMIGVSTAIRDGDTTIEEQFPREDKASDAPQANGADFSKPKAAKTKQKRIDDPEDTAVEDSDKVFTTYRKMLGDAKDEKAIRSIIVDEIATDDRLTDEAKLELEAFANQKLGK